MKLDKYLNSGQKFVIQDEDGNILAYPAYLEAMCVHHYDNERESYSFFDTPENVSKQISYFIQDHHDILMVDMQHHPEQKWNEIYMGNGVNPFSDDHFYSLYDTFNRDGIGWKSKRYGKVAYTTDGEVIRNMVPIFVERAEIEQAIKSKELDIELYGDKAYGAKENIRVWQSMLDRGTVF